MTAPATRSAAPPETLVARFRADLERLWPASGARGLAVSGGPDSLAMMLLAQAAIPGQFEVATVDHGLRPASAGEAAMVAALCAERGIPHATLPVTLEPGNVQHQARAARYQALGGWAEERELTCVCTAHHLDDQAETLLMRLHRGSGVRGLAGIRARTGMPGCYLPLLRPLLDWRRDALARIVADAGIVPVADPSNQDERFDRARVRRELAAAAWIDPAGLARSAAHLAEMEELLDFMIGREWTQCVEPADAGFRYAALRTGLPGVNAVRIGVIESVGRALGSSGIDTGAAARMVEALLRGETRNIGGIAGTVADVAGERWWLFRPEPPRRTR